MREHETSAGARNIAEEERLQQGTVAPTERDYDGSLEHDAGDARTVQIVCFYLDDDQYAFELGDAVEVLKPRELTEVPRIPDFILGILSVRGEMIPVVDLKKRLELGSWQRSADSRLLVASFEDLKAGFLIDRISGVEEVPQRAVKAERSAPRFIKGMIRLKKRTIRLLDVKKLLDIPAA